jgi:2-dehydropantoate 2-reductase
MKVAILGSGAIGSFVGSALLKGGADVWFVDKYKDHVDAINKDGLIVEVKNQKETLKAKASNNGAEVGVCDVVIVLVKGPQTRSSIEEYKELFDKNTFVVTLQNGVGNADILFEMFAKEKVGYGVMHIASKMIAPGHVSGMLTDHYDILFRGADPNIKPAKLAELEKIFNDGGMRAYYSNDADKFIWKKMVVNCAVNITCGLVRVTMGQLFDANGGEELQKNIVKELIEVANALGVDISFEEGWKYYTVENLPAIRAHYPSATQDIMKKRPTEIDFLNGAVSRLGKQLGISTPVNDTITLLQHALEDTYSVQF